VDPTALAERAAGVERLEAAVAAYDEATTSRITGVDRELLRAFVDAVVAAGRLAVLSGTGSTMSRSGNANEWLAWALMVLTNSFDEPGGMWFNPGAFTRLDRLPRLPEAAPSAPSAMSRPDIARCGGEWPASVIPDEIEAGRLRALIGLGANLITAVPGPERMARALADIDVLIVLDVQRNSTSDLATHVFACAGQLERPDVLPLELNANAVYQHYSEPVVTPRDDRPPMWQTMARIGAGVGLDVLGGVDPLATTTDEMLARMARGTALADLRAAGGLRVESGPVYGWVRSRLPFGRWDLAPERLVAQLEALDAPAPLVLTPRRLVKRMNWQLFREGERHDALVHPDDAAEAGVADGDVVDVVSPVGSLRLAVRVSDTVVRGAVSIVHGFADANVNVLVDAHDLDPLTGMARLSGVPVTLTRLR
jgi:anaerobic selenocysteine-containing dehydrogenase